MALKKTAGKLTERRFDAAALLLGIVLGVALAAVFFFVITPADLGTENVFEGASPEETAALNGLLASNPNYAAVGFATIPSGKTAPAGWCMVSCESRTIGYGIRRSTMKMCSWTRCSAPTPKPSSSTAPIPPATVTPKPPVATPTPSTAALPLPAPSDTLTFQPSSTPSGIPTSISGAFTQPVQWLTVSSRKTDAFRTSAPQLSTNAVKVAQSNGSGAGVPVAGGSVWALYDVGGYFVKVGDNSTYYYGGTEDQLTFGTWGQGTATGLPISASGGSTQQARWMTVTSKSTSAFRSKDQTLKTNRVMVALAAGTGAGLPVYAASVWALDETRGYYVNMGEFDPVAGYYTSGSVDYYAAAAAAALPASQPSDTLMLMPASGSIMTSSMGTPSQSTNWTRVISSRVDAFRLTDPQFSTNMIQVAQAAGTGSGSTVAEGSIWTMYDVGGYFIPLATGSIPYYGGGAIDKLAFKTLPATKLYISATGQQTEETRWLKVTSAFAGAFRNSAQTLRTNEVMVSLNPKSEPGAIAVPCSVWAFDATVAYYVNIGSCGSLNYYSK